MKTEKLTLILITCYMLWVLSLLSRGQEGLDDFNVFFNAGQRLSLGQNIYGPPHFNDLRYFYSPLFASLLSLFSGYTAASVKLGWFLINTLLLLRCCIIVFSYCQWKFRGSAFVLLLLFLISGKIVLINFLTNQATVLMLWSMLESFTQYRRQHYWLSLLILCIGINIKIIPVVLLPYYFSVSVGRFRFLSAFVAVSLLLLLLPMLWLGASYNTLLLSEWWNALNPAKPMHVVQVYESGFMDIGALLTKYFCSDPVADEPVINIYNLSYYMVFIITNSVRLLLLGAVMLVCARIRKNMFGIDRHFLCLVAFMALAPLIMPHQRDYSFLLSIPLIAVLILLVIRRGKPAGIALFSIGILLSGVFAWSDITGFRAVDMFYDYRLITLGMLALLLQYLLLLYRITKDAAPAEKQHMLLYTYLRKLLARNKSGTAAITG